MDSEDKNEPDLQYPKFPMLLQPNFFTSMRSHDFQYKDCHRHLGHRAAFNNHAICPANRLRNTMEDRERILENFSRHHTDDPSHGV